MRKESEESELEPGEVIACRYRVEAHYRTHPLGELYCCCDLSGGARGDGGENSSVLLQRLRREFALPGVQDRLFETRGSASLESPVIADILDYGEDIDGRPFLVTAWSDDISLDGVERPLGFAEAVAIVVRVAEALAPLHARGLLHGGIEPASVLVDDQRELTGMLGFGLAPALAADRTRALPFTRALPLLVSPGYAAPELITGQPLGPQADVYALGILLWELIFAQVPFRGATLRVLDAHLNRALPGFELPFDAPASFEPTLRRMLAKRPDDRFADAGAVAEQLRRHLLEPVIFAPVLLEPTMLEPIVERPDDDEDETVMFEAVRDRIEVPRIQLRHELVPQPVHAHRSRSSRVGPKLALALTMCVSLVLLSVWAVERDRMRLAPEQLNSAEHALASATGPSPIAVEAISRAAQPSTQETIDAAALSKSNSAGRREKLGASTFREQKDELYGGIERVCTQGGVRRTVKLAVRVDGRGRVEAATVLGKMGSSKLGRCVEAQARTLAFPASREGGYYVYTLRLRP